MGRGEPKQRVWKSRFDFDNTKTGRLIARIAFDPGVDKSTRAGRPLSARYMDEKGISVNTTFLSLAIHVTRFIAQT